MLIISDFPLQILADVPHEVFAVSSEEMQTVFDVKTNQMM